MYVWVLGVMVVSCVYWVLFVFLKKQCGVLWGGVWGLGVCACVCQVRCCDFQLVCVL